MSASGPRARGASVHPRPCQGVKPWPRTSAASGLALATQKLDGITGRGTSSSVLPVLDYTPCAGSRCSPGRASKCSRRRTTRSSSSRRRRATRSRTSARRSARRSATRCSGQPLRRLATARRAGDDRRRAAGAADPGASSTRGGGRSTRRRPSSSRRDRARPTDAARRGRPRAARRGAGDRRRSCTPGFARRFTGRVVVHDVEDPGSSSSRPACASTRRSSRRTPSSSVPRRRRSSTAARRRSLAAAGVEALRAADADSLLETRNSRGWRLARRARAARWSGGRAVIGVSLALNHPRLDTPVAGLPVRRRRPSSGSHARRCGGCSRCFPAPSGSGCCTRCGST